MDDFDTYFKDIKKEALAPYEKEAMRRELQLFMKEHPVRVSLANRVFARFTETFRVRTLHVTRFASATLALILILGVGAGTSYAAESALPGDALYTVKIHVNEGVISALATSPQAKADWNAERLSRRFQEAEDLAARSDLTPTNVAVVQAGLDAAAQGFDASVSALAQTSADASRLAAAQSDLQETLLKHAKVLETLAADHPDAETQIHPILALANVSTDHADHPRAESTAPAAAPAIAAKRISHEQRPETPMPNTLTLSVESNFAATTSAQEIDTTAAQSEGLAAPRQQEDMHPTEMHTMPPTYTKGDTKGGTTGEADTEEGAISRLKHALGVKILPLQSATSSEEASSTQQASTTDETGDR